MYDLISIGNISIDLYFQGDSLTRNTERFTLAIGGKYTTDFFYEGLGGGGVNVAIGAQKMGLSCAVIAKIGSNQFKSLILDHLKNNNISSDLCQYEDAYIKVSSILLTHSGERTIINYETPHGTLFSDEQQMKKIIDTKMVYMSNLPRVSLEERIAILSFLNKHHVKTMINLGNRDCTRPLKEILPLIEKTDILTLNGHEFSLLIKTPYDSIDFKKNITSYVPSLANKVVIITDGNNGSYGYANGTVYYQDALKVDKVVDTTGAGDGYTAGFIAQYVKTANVQESMKYGAEYAIKIIQKIGAN